MTADLHDIDEERWHKAVALIVPKLIKTERGYSSCVNNLIQIIGLDPRLSGLCGYDEFACRPMLLRAPPSALEGSPPLPGPYPRAWDSADVSLIQAYLQRVWTRSAATTETESAMLAVAKSRRYHPVRDYLAGLAWDGMSRVDRWLIDTFGCPDDEYHRAIGAKFLLAMVRRVRDPGCQHDYTLILEGDQGIKKSSALRALVGDAWFTDRVPPDLNHKDAAIGLQGKWLLEFSEIEHLIRLDPEVLKAYLTCRIDHYKPPYSKNFVDVPRQSAFAGSTNNDDYLRDPTGNRRYWPARTEFADPDWVAGNRDQLWAEAAAREAAGETHWLDDADVADTARAQQASRQQEDTWDERIAEALAHRTQTTTAEVLAEVIGVPLERHDRKLMMRVAGCLRRLGWRKTDAWNAVSQTSHKAWLRR